MDAIALSNGLTFNKSTLKVEGFVYLGEYTPEEQQNQVADHALILMFRPFKGDGVQVLLQGQQLFYIVLEGVLLTERTGFFVDTIVADGASWNAVMREKFGVTANKPYAEHPADSSRKLWVLTDFQHIIKLMKSRVVLKKELTVSSQGAMC